MKILFRGELEDEKDSILFVSKNLPKKSIRKLSKINIDDLAVFYSNPCIADGDIKGYRFEKNGTVKNVQIHNIYHEELFQVNELINQVVPEKYKMGGINKDSLIKYQERCGRIDIRESWEN